LLLLTPVLAGILWLPLRSGGTDQFPLIGIEAATFGALALTAFRREMRFPGPRAFWLAIGVTLAAALVSTAFSKDLDASVPALMGWLWLGATVVLVASHSGHLPDKLLGGVLVAAVAIQAFWGFFVWWGGGDPADTQSGTFYAPNQYAGFLLLLAPMLIAPALLVRPRREAAAWGVLAAFVCLGVVLSGSRGGFVALGIGVVITTALTLRASSSEALARAVVLIGLIASMGFIFTSPIVLSDRSEGPATSSPLENVAIKGSASPSIDMRLRWVEGAVRIGKKQPITGSGLATYGDMLVQVQEPYWSWSRYAHNHYAEAFAEGGIFLALGVVAIPFTAILGRSPVVKRVSDPRTIGMIAGLLAGFAHLVVDHDWSFPAYALVYVVLATTVASNPQPGRTPLAERTWTAPIPVAILALVLLIAVLLRGQALRYQSLTENVTVGPTVTKLAPYSATAQLRHAREMVRSRNLDGAAVAIEKAISLDQLEPRLRWQAAEIYLEADRLQDAKHAYLEAIRISPNAPAAYRLAAEFHLAINEPKDALEILDQGLTRLSKMPGRERLSGPIAELVALRDEVAAAD